jgi:hypothetical protein
MDTGGVAPMHAEGESNGVAVLLAGVGEGVPLPVGEESGGEEAELSSSANEGGGLELTLYSWSERRSKSKRGWKQRQQAVHRVAADSTADSAKAGEESALLQLLNGGSGDNSSNEDESDKEAEESTALEHQYEHVEQDRNGEIRRETVRSKRAQTPAPLANQTACSLFCPVLRLFVSFSSSDGVASSVTNLSATKTCTCRTCARMTFAPIC